MVWAVAGALETETVAGDSASEKKNSAESDWQAYLDAIELTHRLIDAGSPRTPNRDAAADRARYRLDRLTSLLAALENPHQRIPLIHIAGTSGKGSTAAAIAAGLSAAGYRTGLHTSPYLQSATENLRLDDVLISGRAFATAVHDVYRAAEQDAAFENQPVSYGELWMALTLHWFASAGADVAVIETGAGGRFDLSNVIDPVLSVITTIGLDHTETLGPTLADIAWHKAGIIKPGVPVVTGVRDAESLDIIVREAQQTGSRLVLPDWNDQRDYTPNLPGSLYQSANAAVAAASLHELNRLGFTLPETAIVDGVADARLPGRFETVQQTPHILVDGAHNPQKMAAFASTLSKFRLPEGARRTIVFGALEAKSHGEMLGSLKPLANRFVLTSPQVYGKRGADPNVLAAELRSTGFAGDVLVAETPDRAIDLALQGRETGDEIAVTGSMYLIGNIRERWYATRAIVEQQTSWPAGA
jgi:dihydrofolate synthase/folylpolyglutamate synthase